MAIGRGLSKVTSPLRWLKLNWLVLVGLGSIAVKGGFKLLFYGGLKMYDLGGLRIDWCQSVWLPFDLDYMWVIYKSV